MASRIQIRRDTAANWSSVNPVLAQGEIGFELNTGKIKIGNGTAAWNSLDYFADNNATAGAREAGAIVPGQFPNLKYPAVRTSAAISGNNLLYTVPAGRKALVVDYIVSNSTASAIVNYPFVRIGGVDYRTGASFNEPANGWGHNYSFASSRSQPIVLNAGESFGVVTDAAGLTIWAHIIEFDELSPFSRADIRNWTAGANTLLLVPANKTIAIGAMGLTSGNLPAPNATGIVYFNASGATRTLSAINIVPFGEGVALANQFATTNNVFNNTLFSKFFHGNLAAGDSIVLTSDSDAAGQFAWCNYLLL
jgi:hypothetical protein